DHLAPLILTQTFAREDPHIDDCTFHAGRNSQRGVTHLSGLLAEDRAQQLFFRRQLGFTLRRNFADENMARLDLSADANDAALLEIRERLIANVWNIAGDFFGTELGVARDALELLDVYRGINIFFYHQLAEQHSIFEVVAPPGHQRHHHVATQSKLAHFGGRSIGDDVAGFHLIADDDDRPLINTSILIRALIFDEIDR